MAAKLKVSRIEATQKISAQMMEGKKCLRAQQRSSLELQAGLPLHAIEDRYKRAVNAVSEWRDYTEEVLRYCFTDDSESLAFSGCFSASRPIRRSGTPMESAITKLKTLLGRLPLIPEEGKTDALAALGGVDGAPKESEKAAGRVPFTHTPDYSSVNLRGRAFTLTPRQAEVIKILHEAFVNKTPDLHQDYIKARLNMGDSARLKDRFRSAPDAWKYLIARGQRKGTLRLNI